MQVKVNKPKPGEWYPIRFCKPYPLPVGLHPDDLVTVTGFEHGYYRVRNKADCEFTLFMLSVQTGYVYELDGEWLEPDDPRILTFHKNKADQADSIPDRLRFVPMEGDSYFLS